jgi:hypothetical protein
VLIPQEFLPLAIVLVLLYNGCSLIERRLFMKFLVGVIILIGAVIILSPLIGWGILFMATAMGIG